MSATTTTFFEEQQEQSQVKANIVQKYFHAWSNVMIPLAKKGKGKIAYIDLFAGPGRYKDGSVSTPILVLRKAAENPDLAALLVALFNDKDDANTRTLEEEIKRIPGIDKLKYAPTVKNLEVGDEIVKRFEAMQHVPTLMFVDPWGYKGLSLRLVNAVLKDWGCECVFFFNYNRINMGLSNPAVAEHMEALFGETRAAQLMRDLAVLDSSERELTIVEALCEALKEYGGKFVLPFRFRTAKGNRTSHHLIFVSKHLLGYKIMKDIMARESSTHDEGVPSFEYSPASERQPLLFSLSRPIEDLKETLLREFAGRTVVTESLIEQHHVGRQYIERNYKDALKALEVAGQIVASPPASKRPRNSFANKTLVTFPPLAGHT